MKKILVFPAILILTALSSFGQTREDITVHIPQVMGRLDFAGFFQENFAMETTAAGYIVVDNPNGADYTLKLETKPNLILYDDGTYEEVGPDSYYVDEETGEIVREKQFLLQINLVRNEDNNEIVAFTFPFSNLEEMYDFNLYLLYEAMANVPLTKLGSVAAADERWRNKWLYLRTSFDFPITFYVLKEPEFLTHRRENEDPQVQGLDHRISPWVAATIGVELHYHYRVSTELNFNLSFSDPMTSTFMPSILIEQKFPIKPSTHFMIEPYAALAFPMSTSPNVNSFPRVGLGGGVQAGVKGGSMGAFFLDVNFIYFLGNVVMKNADNYYTIPNQITYKRYSLGLGIGYKIGFMDRPMPKPKEQP